MRSDNFSEAEKKGREIIEEHIQYTGVFYEFTTSKYDLVDLITSKDGITSATTEIKNRENYSSTNTLIQEKGAVLEKTKYDGALKATHSSGMTDCYYCCIFNDGVAYIWKLSELTNIEWVEEVDKYPKTTAVKGKKVTKTVTYLPLKTAKKIILDKHKMNEPRTRP